MYPAPKNYIILSFYISIIILLSLSSLSVRYAEATNTSIDTKQATVKVKQLALPPSPLKEKKNQEDDEEEQRGDKNSSFSSKRGLVLLGTSSLSLSVLEDSVVFNELLPTNPLLRKISLKSFGGNLVGYSLYLFEDKAPTDMNEFFIPDTTCDTGSCTESTSSLWKNTLSFGFGYRCEANKANVCPEDFSQKDSYRRFPQEETFSFIEPLLKGSYQQPVQEADIIVKTNISNTQKVTTYENTLTILAVPDY